MEGGCVSYNLADARLPKPDIMIVGRPQNPGVTGCPGERIEASPIQLCLGKEGTMSLSRFMQGCVRHSTRLMKVHEVAFSLQLFDMACRAQRRASSIHPAYRYAKKGVSTGVGRGLFGL